MRYRVEVGVNTDKDAPPTVESHQSDVQQQTIYNKRIPLISLLSRLHFTLFKKKTAQNICRIFFSKISKQIAIYQYNIRFYISYR